MTTKQQTDTPLNIGIVGARGYVGRELIHLIELHPTLTLHWLSSRQLAGQPLNQLVPTSSSLVVENLSPIDVAKRSTDIIILALPNGLAAPFVDALLADNSRKPLVILDLSADYRFDPEWNYSVAEISGFKNLTATEDCPVKISNPGCYATAMQLVIEPVKDILSNIPNCFGISGYSGAGTKPSPNNDPNRLKDNLLPYQLVEHLHEKEVSYHLGQPVSFTPHVAQFFRGINMTIQCQFASRITSQNLLEIFQHYYADDTLIEIQSEIPNLQQVVGSHRSIIGGFATSSQGDRGTIVCCLDNLLKGAASQAIQNLNIAFGLNKDQGLALSTHSDLENSEIENENWLSLKTQQHSITDNPNTTGV